MMNFFHRFIPGLTRLLKPLHDVANLKRNFTCGSQQIAAFENAKSALAAASCLAFPQPTAPTRLVVSLELKCRLACW